MKNLYGHTLEEQFRARIAVQGEHWIWNGPTHGPRPYLSYDRTSWSARKLAMRFSGGDDTAPMYVVKCGQRMCVRPEHLEPRHPVDQGDFERAVADWKLHFQNLTTTEEIMERYGLSRRKAERARYLARQDVLAGRRHPAEKGSKPWHEREKRQAHPASGLRLVSSASVPGGERETLEGSGGRPGKPR